MKKFVTIVIFFFFLLSTEFFLTIFCFFFLTTRCFRESVYIENQGSDQLCVTLCIAIANDKVSSVNTLHANYCAARAFYPQSKNFGYNEAISSNKHCCNLFIDEFCQIYCKQIIKPIVLVLFVDYFEH